MGAVSQNIPNLLGGVSQQPDPVKLPGQVREAVNVYLDPTFGCKKRPPTEFKGVLAADIPDNAKWFPIFRDNSEKYIVAIYNTADDATVRVWDASTGDERVVNADATSKVYLQTSDISDISHLSIADYTLIANQGRTVSMSGSEPDEDDEEALVAINALAFNTTYSIDLNGGENTEQTRAYRAKKIEVIPGSFEVSDGGVCTENDAAEYIEDGPDGKTGLAFRLVVNCNAVLRGRTYYSNYDASVILRNGGANWREGDEVTVTQNGRDYTIRVTEDDFDLVYASDGSVSTTTPANDEAGGLNVGTVTGDLAEAINLLDNYEAETVGNIVKITKTNGESFNLGVRGGTSNRAMTAIKSSAQDIAELPSQCWDGYKLKVANTENSDADDYWVEFATDVEGIPGKGSWIECVEPGITTNFNSSTMPFALIRRADGDFDLKPLDDTSALGGWGDRNVGDETTNPVPTFVGRGVSGMFFYQNRLGFLSEDAVIMSQPGDYFNFWNNSAITISDADPIDMTASSTKPAFLRNALGTAKGLLLFADNNQFLLSSEEIVFGPKTVRINEIADYKYRSQTDPLSTGVSVAFVTEADTYSKIFEMAVDSIDNRPQVAEISRAIPEYIPTGLKWNTNSPNNSLMIWGDESHECYAFKFYNNGNERQLAGWVKWIFPAPIRMCSFDNDTAYIVCRNPDGTTILLEMELLDDPDTAPIVTDFTKFIPRLDHFQYKNDLTVGNEGQVYLPKASYPGTGTICLIITEGTSSSLFLRESEVVDYDADNYMVTFPTWAVAEQFIIGIQYEMRLELPAFYVQQEKRADRVDVPTVEILYVDLYKSGSYTVHIEKQGYDEVTYEVPVALADVYQANTPVLSEVSTTSVPIMSIGSIAYPTIRAVDPLPSSVTSYSWQGHYNKRGIRLIG